MPNAPIYNSGSVPFGSKLLDFKNPDGSALATRRVENIQITRPGNVIRRPNELGADVNESTLTPGPVTATMTVQVPLTSSTRIYLGCYVQDDFGGGYHAETGVYTAGVERLVVDNVGDPFAMNGYWVQNISLHRVLTS